ncbi:MAG: hypothetical protein ABSB40_01370 [Nitrososphaeria archaeon]|jgi:hypothetical protein
MPNLVKCSRCDKVFIWEEFEKHSCTPWVKGFKEIRTPFWYEHETQDGRKTINFDGLDDGISYKIILEKEREAIEYLPTITKRKFTDEKPNKDLTKPFFNLKI